MSSLIAATASVGELQLTKLAVEASKPGTYPMLCVYSFWAPDDGRKNRLKHVEYWQ
jgi:hypothetical protein